MTISDAVDSCSFYEADVERYRVPLGSFSFHRQYSQIYAARLHAAKPVLEAKAMQLWKATHASTPTSSGDPPIRSLAELTIDERCVIIGTIYKEMHRKPSILRELVTPDPENISVVETPVNSTTSVGSLTSSEDRLYMEDEVQRIALRFCDKDAPGGFSADTLITGVVMALLGYEGSCELGYFKVEDAIYLEPHPVRPIQASALSLPKQCVDFHSSGPWLAVVSGLGFTGTGKVSPGYAMAVELLGDWLRRAGALPDNSTVSASRQGIVRLLILGDSIRTASNINWNGSDGDTKPVSRLAQQAQYLARRTEADSVAAMSCLDDWLSGLPLGTGCNSPSVDPNGLPVTILPGAADPTSRLFPQLPLHPATLPAAVSRAGGAKTGGLQSLTNPATFRIEARNILATSGQGVNDLFHYTTLESCLDRMEATLRWGHLAPTCPDTLLGYPLADKDLLSLRVDGPNAKKSKPEVVRSIDYPDIYVSGCQPGERPTWRRAKLRNEDGSTQDGALLVAVPRFDVTHSLVLIHLTALQCQIVRFDVSWLDEHLSN